MATSILYSVAVSLKLDNGTDSSGNQLLVSQSFPSINKTLYDDDKTLSIVTALAPCITKEVMEVRKTTQNLIAAD